MGIIQKPKLVQADLANPKKVVASWPDNVAADHVEVVGTIVGMVTNIKVTTQKAKDGLSENTYVALEGNFEGTPANPERDIVQSGICYLSEAFMSPIIAQFGVVKDAEFIRNENAPRAVSIVCEVLLLRATNVHGYSWGLRPVQDPNAVDPLAELKALLPGNKAKAIEAPKPAKK